MIECKRFSYHLTVQNVFRTFSFISHSAIFSIASNILKTRNVNMIKYFSNDICGSLRYKMGMLRIPTATLIFIILKMVLALKLYLVYYVIDYKLQSNTMPNPTMGIPNCRNCFSSSIPTVSDSISYS